MRKWFLNDPERFRKLSLTFEDCLFDFSKNRINRQTLSLLVELMEQCQLEDAIKQLFGGSNINETEDRAVLHTALRHFGDEPVLHNGRDVMPAVREVQAQMKEFSGRIIDGSWKGFSDESITDVVNIGIGGSDLGPAMVYDALKPYHLEGIRCHYVSNVDGAHISETLKGLNPARTLFIVASKSFTTQETMANAHSARQWFLESDAGEADIARHFVAVSTNSEKVKEFGIAPANMFVFWDWVGGRYSVWSAIGLSLCCGLGYDRFEELLKGAHAMDRHFATTGFEENLPVLMAGIGIWYVNFMGAESEAVIPYNQNLQRFPAYLQQANMESNGKMYDRNSEKLSYHSGAVIWGEPGTNSQHAFFQLLHQGSRFIPIDFIGFVHSHYSKEHHQSLMANFFAQSEALMRGRTIEEVEHQARQNGQEDDSASWQYKVFEGNRPSTTILAPLLSPYYLGMLMALYEHKIMVQGIVWNIYSFDQWGVELGKVLAKGILPHLKAGKGNIHEHDNSTMGLLKFYLEREKSPGQSVESK